MTPEPRPYDPHPFDALREDDLRHPDSAKWNFYPPEVLPLWVADMDFPVAPEITAALHARLSRSIGYSMGGEPGLLDVLQARHVLEGREHVWLLPGVVPGLYASVLALSAPGDEVITHTPIYPPFLGAIENQGRVARLAPLLQGESGWEIDWDALEAAVTPAARVLMLCSPHNPSGRLWSRPELERLAEFALRHRLWVVADELHADLTLEGEFIPFARLSPDIARRTVTLSGPCKAFNTAGLPIGAAFSANAALIARLQRAALGLMGHPSALSIEMWRAALEHGGPWLEGTLAYLRGNRDFLAAELARQLPEVHFAPPQATYLAWLDFRAFSWAEGPHLFALERAKVGLNDGATFGPGFEGFLRLNFATSRPLLGEAVRRLAEAARAHAAEHPPQQRMAKS